MLIESKSLNNKLIVTKIISVVLLLLAFSVPLSTSFTSLLLMLFMLLWLIEGDFQAKANYILQHSACFSTIFLLIGLTIGCIYSLASWQEITLFLKKMVKLIYLPFFIYYFKDPIQRKWTINALIIAGIITTAVGLLYYSNQPIKNTIDTSLIITVTTLLLLHKIDSINKLQVNLSILMLCLINVFYLFYISTGRTAQLLFILLMPVFLFQKLKHKNRKLLIFFSSLAIMSVLLFCCMFSKSLYLKWHDVITTYNDHKINSAKYTTDTSISGRHSVAERLLFYQNSLSLIKQKPWLGWGTGSFIPAYKQFSEKNNTMVTTNPHNEYLLWGVQLGLFGVCLLIWWFYFLFKTSLVLQDYEKYVLQSMIFIISIGCLANSWLMDFVSGHLFIILTAISLGALPINARLNPNH